MTFVDFWRQWCPSTRFADDLYRLRAALDRTRIEYMGMGPELALNSQPSMIAPGSQPQAEAEPFQFPLPGPVRVASIEGNFRRERNVRAFSEKDIAWLHFYAPEALV